MANPEYYVRIPTSEQKAKVNAVLTGDDVFKFPTIKLDKDTPTYSWAKPTEDNEFNRESATSFVAVILLARKNTYQSPEQRERGEEVKERRELYILRSGKLTPERIFVSPSSVRNWLMYCKLMKDSGNQYFYTLCKFTATRVNGKNGFNWSAPKFEICRTLKQEEREYIDELRPLVAGRVSQYVAEEELAKYEDEVLSEGKYASVDPEQAHVASVHRELEEAEITDGKRSKKEKEPEPAQDEPAKKAELIQKEPEPRTQSTARAGYPSLDEEEDDPPAPKQQSQRRTVTLDDDDE